jgi:hypothetical protein
MTHTSEMPSSLARATRAALASADLGIDATDGWIVGNRRVGVKHAEAVVLTCSRNRPLWIKES